MSSSALFNEPGTSRRSNSTIAACLVVQNAERILADCLTRLKPFVDEIVVADLASTDRSAAIAGEYGARIVVLPSTESVSTARQTCQQRSGADWVVFIDPADQIPEHTAELFRSVVATQDDEAQLVEIASENGNKNVDATSRSRTLQFMRKSTSVAARIADLEKVGNLSSVIDVIILSYAMTAKEYQMTHECIRSLRASEPSIDFNVVVVETNTPENLRQLSGEREPFDDRCQVVFPQKEFNYNEFLQFGFVALGASTAAHLLITNNDVLFEHGFARALLGGLRSFASVSPWCSGAL